MNEPTLQSIEAELSDRLVGRKFGKIFVLSKFQLAIDFRLQDDSYLFISVEPRSPRIYFIQRRIKALDRYTGSKPVFFDVLRKNLSNATVRSVRKLTAERIIQIGFDARSELGQPRILTLVVQLTGRSSNLFLLNTDNEIIDSLRKSVSDGQFRGAHYQPPTRDGKGSAEPRRASEKGDHPTLSEALDAFYTGKEKKERFDSISGQARKVLRDKMKGKKRLRKRLGKDLEKHGDPARLKRLGEVLLANVGTAQRDGNTLVVTDYFDENTPSIEIEIDEGVSVAEAAEKYFKKYGKARSAVTEIGKRVESLEGEIEGLESEQAVLEQAISDGDTDAVRSFLPSADQKRSANRRTAKGQRFTGARRFESSDGFEILVGKRSKDNDYLTFRVAKSLDTWMHTADYPGSHVIVRNPDRKEIPGTTLVEAAQLAAFYSKARKDSKAAVHYTQKKFVNKPKGGAPGLVSLSRFKTIMVEPKVIAK